MPHRTDPMTTSSTMPTNHRTEGNARCHGYSLLEPAPGKVLLSKSIPNAVSNCPLAAVAHTKPESTTTVAPSTWNPSDLRCVSCEQVGWQAAGKVASSNSKRPLLFAFVTAFLSFAINAPAWALYKCVTPTGVVYQDKPCTVGSETEVGQKSPHQVHLEEQQIRKEYEKKREAEMAVWKEQAEKRRIAEKEQSDQTKVEESKKQQDRIALLNRCLSGKISCEADTVRILVGHFRSYSLLDILGPPKNRQLIGETEALYWDIKLMGRDDKVRAHRFQVIVRGCDRPLHSTDICSVNVYN